MNSLMTNLYYLAKPLVPRPLQIIVRQQAIRRAAKSLFRTWPIDESAYRPPQRWTGWPGQKQFALILTHDVDTKRGHERCRELINLEEQLGFRSAYYFVPERYQVSPEIRHYLISNGFEVGVHGLKHDGKLYRSRKIFQERAPRINHYLKEWNSVGFRSPSMHHNLEWIHDLDIEYDASTFDTDPFEPQADGVGTVFPFWVRRDIPHKRYLELPYTLPQDFTLFVLMQEKTIDLWKRKLDWLAEKRAMALVIVHPDYTQFAGDCQRDEYPAQYYADFLAYVKQKYHGSYWNVLPKDLARFWRRFDDA
jgi:hypothetical protein